MNQRERLLLTITHDIKAPAASISGFIDLMKDYVDNPQAISCLNSIKGSATHLSRLVAALLDYHQLENGLMMLSVSACSFLKASARRRKKPLRVFITSTVVFFAT